MKQREVKYSILARAIREQIAAGTYKMGDRLPSENELSEEFSFSRQTVRQALGILEREGYLVRRRGSGTYVAKESPGLKKSRTIGVITTYITDYIFPVITKPLSPIPISLSIGNWKAWAFPASFSTAIIGNFRAASM